VCSASREATEQQLADLGLVSGFDQVILNRICRAGRVCARLQRREAVTDRDLVALGLLPVVLLHLGMDEGCQGMLIELQDSSSVILRQVRQEVPNGLAGQIVEQIRLLVVGHVVEVHQTSNDIVLKAPFLDACVTERQDLMLLGPEGVRI
jgi:hypothetical protein